MTLPFRFVSKILNNTAVDRKKPMNSIENATRRE